MPKHARARLALGLMSAGTLMLALAVPAVVAANKGVAIRDFAFAPGTVEIRVGDSVRWTNRDSVAHTATARNGSFDTGLLGEGQSRSVRFTAPGTYRYLCTPHPNMTGTIVVKAASGGLRPPNTDTITEAAAPAEQGSEGPPIGVLAVVGGLAYLVAQRLFRRRHETADAFAT